MEGRSGRLRGHGEKFSLVLRRLNNAGKGRAKTEGMTELEDRNGVPPWSRGPRPRDGEGRAGRCLGGPYGIIGVQKS